MTGYDTWLNHWTTNEYIYSQLLDMEVDNETLTPDVAESWDISDDGLTWTFHLRKDVEFHDGEPLTAGDVKFSVEMQAHPDMESLIWTRAQMDVIEGAEAYHNGEADEISGVKVLDDFTLQIAFTVPRWDILLLVGQFNIHPKHLYGDIPFSELLETEYAVEKPVGSGPFKMGKLVYDQYYIVEAFEDYYAGRPYLDRIIFRIGMVTWIPALEAGEIDHGAEALGEDYARLADNPDLVLVGGPGGCGHGINFNTERLTPKVRQAIAYALDRDAIARAVFGDKAYAPKGPYLGGPEYVSPNIEWYGYDPDKARALLEEEGWDFDQEIDLVGYYRDDLNARAGVLMQQYWGDVGLKVDVRWVDSATWTNQVREEDDWWIAYSCATGMPNPSARAGWRCGKHLSHYCNEEFDEVIEQGLVEMDPEKRRLIMQRVSEIFFEDPPYAPTWVIQRFFPVNKNLCNYRWGKAAYMIGIDQRPNTWYLATTGE